MVLYLIFSSTFKFEIKINFRKRKVTFSIKYYVLVAKKKDA